MGHLLTSLQISEEKGQEESSNTETKAKWSIVDLYAGYAHILLHFKSPHGLLHGSDILESYQ